MISRRGFLQAMAASAVGAAVYDVDTKLWVPGREIIIPAAEVQLAEIVRLNQAAAYVALLMGQRLESHDAFGLRDIVYRHTGNVGLPAGVLELIGAGTGYFQGTQDRKMITVSSLDDKVLESAAFSLSRHVIDRKLDAFAPLTHALRPGDAFDKDMLIGLATDPESGVSVRALQWQQVAGGLYGPQTVFGFEIAAGRWHPYQASKTKLAAAAALCALSTFGGDESS